MADQEQTILEHLGDVKNLFIKMFAAWAIATLGTVFISDVVFELITRPIPDADLYFFSPADSFLFLVKIHVIMGFFISFPLLLWLVWSYIVDIFNQTQRRVVTTLVPISLILSYVGLVYGYVFLIPSSVELLMNIQPPNTAFLISADEYISFTLGLLLAMIFVFQLPLVIFSLIKTRVLQASFFQNRRKEFYFAFVVATAIFTPTPDVFTLALIVIPILIMYEVAVFFGDL